MSSYNGRGIAYSNGVGADITNTEKQTIIEYDLKFEPNACDYRTVEFYKDYKIAVLTLKGKVVDQSGGPVPDLFVFLYPKTAGQNFMRRDYRVGKTGNSGEYDIRNLKPGEYILGINLGGTPPQEVPYPPTFFPGKLSLSEAQIITLTESKDLILPAFVLPPKLRTVKITGKAVWQDGSPAAKSSDDASAKVNPRIYRIDPLTLESTLDGLIVTDKDGNFSFTGFEGYSYILHADGVDAAQRSRHSKHILIKAEENTAPIILKLNLPGEGTSVEDVKRDLGLK
jgi:protocatechuate 3,4-dioxygenase beta subunit